MKKPIKISIIIPVFNEEKIIIDPGIGFGKKGNDNLLILNG